MSPHDDEPTDCAQAMLAGALAEHFGQKPPDLVASIVARTRQSRAAGFSDSLRTQNRSRSLAAAAIVVLGATAVLAVGILAKRELAPAQEPAQDPAGRFWPLDPGATWVYDVDRQGVTTQRTQRAMTAFPFQATTEDAPRSVCQMFVRDGNEGGFDYAACDAHGLFRYSGTRRFAVPGLDPAAPVTRLLSLPVGLETRWQTTERRLRNADAGGGPAVGALGGVFGAGAGGKAAGPVGGRSSNATETKQAELVAPTVAVKVPAGEFRATHLRLTTVAAEGSEPIVEQLWFVSGTGLVRRVLEQGGKPIEIAELRSFTRGQPEPDPKAVLAKFLQRDAGVANFGPAQTTEWIDPAARNLRLRSSLAVVTFVDRKLVFCVRGGAVTTFDPADTAQWTSLVGDEQMTQWNDGLLPQARCTAMVDLAARIRAAQQDWKVQEKSPEWRYHVGPAGSDSHYVMHCTDATGEARRVTVDLAVGTDDRVSKVEFS